MSLSMVGSLLEVSLILKVNPKLTELETYLLDLDEIGRGSL